MAAPAPGASRCSAALVSARPLQGVSAASGLEICGATAYVAGDDSVFLYELSLAAGGDPTRVARRVRLCAPRGNANGGAANGEGAANSEERIPKKLKPDFEAMAALDVDGSPHIAVFGSASKAGVRDGIVLIDPATGTRRELDGGALYAALRADTRVTGAAKLNLEAASSLGGGSHIALFQRGNVPGGHNAVVVFKLQDFQDHLRALGGGGGGGAAAAAAPPPAYSVVHLLLPPIDEPGGGGRAFPAGVSGASTVSLPAAGGGAGGADEEFLLLSASYEGTLNEIDDGPVIGSRVALLPSAALLAAAGTGGVGGVPAIDLGNLSALVLPAGGGPPVLAKIEGIAARGCSCGAGGGGGGAEGEETVVVDALGVTDPDGEASQLMELRFEAPAALLRAARAGAV
ncbi:MAG: hypothetical protein J3K34DRAFT_518036 [Monoraphidium minutum]|nr:MAG: hypothetical protein J3K34DRAFT_518036 [Monoraphidium minutum]